MNDITETSSVEPTDVPESTNITEPTDVPEIIDVTEITGTTLTDEGIRLIDLSSHLLNDIKDKDLTLGEASETFKNNKDITFNSKGIDKQLDVLSGERIKIANQETVIAIVGTMKAGKSTTINAIVGTEVLPNRNRPMTALPTLIKHTEGQIAPLLTIENIIPINTLIGTLNEVLNKEGDEILKGRIEIDADIESLIERIYAQGHYKTSYEGSDNIFEFLKELNDLVRVSKALDVPFPFEEYASIDKIPYIKVHFCSLSNENDNNGQLTLLDTPGPNEEGQEHLKVMLEDQLSKCSAVLMVMDYTQLKSTSDAEVRKTVLSVGDEVPIYALVNKFDQKDKNGDGYEGVRKIVSKDLTGGLIPEDKVYPVSSKLAYLGNCAFREISLNGQMPDPDKSPWVVDFAEEAFGRRWSKDILTDNNEVKSSINDIIKDSFFNDPVENIIVQSYKKASFMSVESAAKKLVNLADQLTPYLTLLKQSTETDIEVLNNCTQRLANALKHLSEVNAVVEKKVSNELAEVYSKITTDAENSIRIMDLNIEEHFKRIKTEKSTISFSDEETARSFLDGIVVAVEKIFNERKDDVSISFKEETKRLESKIKSIISESIDPIKDSIIKDLEKDGFDIPLTLQNFNTSGLTVNITNIFEKSIVTNTKIHTEKVRSSGVWGTICRWCNTTDWGWEERTSHKDVYVVNMVNLEHISKGKIREFSDKLNNHIERQILGTMKISSNKFMVAFGATLVNIKLNLEKGKAIQENDKMLAKGTKNELEKKIKFTKQIKKDVEDLVEETLKVKSTKSLS